MKNNSISLAEIPYPDQTPIERQFLYDAVTVPEALPDIMPLINRDFFTSPERVLIWDTIVDLYNRGVNIDFASINSKVGTAFIEEVLKGNNYASSGTDAFGHAKLLRDAHIKRTCYQASINLLSECVNGYKTEEDIYAAIQALTSQVQSVSQITTEVTIQNVMNNIAEEIQEKEVLRKRGESFNIPTGFPSLDWYTLGGWKAGQLIVLAARPSVGKTAIMLHMAKAAAEQGFATLIFSLEMMDSELGQRMLYSTGLVRQTQVANGEVDWQCFESASGQFSGLPIRINDRSRYISDICSRIIINAKQGKCKVAFIDYLGFIKNDTKIANLSQAIGEITSELKATAKAAKIPIILLCQLNRDTVKEGRAPQLIDLRDSGSIEQDADVVLMLEQVSSGIDFHGAAESTPDLKMWIRKNRQFKKEIGIVLRPNETYSSFQEIGSSQ